MISYDYAIEDSGDGYSCIRIFANKIAFDYYMEFIGDGGETYVSDTGVIRVEGHIYQSDLLTLQDVKDLFS